MEPLRRQSEAGPKNRLVGLHVQGRSIARAGSPILSNDKLIGKVTSGTYSPTLDRNIAMGYVLVELAHPGEQIQVDIRGRLVMAEITQLPFYSRNSPP